MNRITSLAVVLTLACGGVLTACSAEKADSGPAPSETPAKTEDALSKTVKDAGDELKAGAAEAVSAIQTIVLEVDGMT